MSWLKVVTTFCFLLAFTQCSPPAKKQEKIVGIKVPTEWIERIRTYNKQDTLLLLRQFEGFIAPDTLDGESENPHYTGVLNDRPPGVIRPTFINLDDDSTQELIGTFGYDSRDPTLAVFKLIDNSWYLLYHESFYDSYGDSELKVANSFSSYKLFYINFLYEHGSSIYRDAYRFFKLINNKVYPCLEITKEAHIYGWGLHLNQQDSTSFQIDSTKSDKILVTYNYDFFSGYDYNIPESNQVNMSFAKGEKTVSYQWDKETLTYRPQLHNLPGEMTSEKITTLARFGDDSLFIKAFAYEIAENLKVASPKEKECLQRYLAFAQNRQKTPGSTSEMEETRQVGEIKFYAPKKK